MMASGHGCWGWGKGMGRRELHQDGVIEVHIVSAVRNWFIAKLFQVHNGLENTNKV